VTSADLEDIAAQASELVGWRVLSVVPVKRGGNNRVFKLVGRGTAAAFKIYPTQKEDPRDRLTHEFGALTFLTRYGVTEVPRPIACDATRHCAAYEWLEGVPPGCADAAAVDELADFFIRIQRMRQLAGAATLPEGATAALSPANVTRQLAQRLERLQSVIRAGTEVAEFVEASLKPAIQGAVDQLRWGCEANGLEFEAPLSPQFRVLSPSDFGFHNALRRPNGKLAFLDFEYFGWDEPSKAVADVMLHAGMSLSSELGCRYRERVTQALRETDPGFPTRFELFFPSMRAIWCLILLNEFLPERWARRVLAGVTEDRAAAEAKQLAKARDMLTRRLV
jgi:phosphotransferase family enzyme